MMKDNLYQLFHLLILIYVGGHLKILGVGLGLGKELNQLILLKLHSQQQLKCLYSIHLVCSALDSCYCLQ